MYTGPRETPAERKKRLANDRNKAYRARKREKAGDDEEKGGGDSGGASQHDTSTERLGVILPSSTPRPRAVAVRRTVSSTPRPSVPRLQRTSTPCFTGARARLDFSLCSKIDKELNNSVMSDDSSILPHSPIVPCVSASQVDRRISPGTQRSITQFAKKFDGQLSIPGLEITPRKSHSVRKAACVVNRCLPESNSLKCLTICSLVKRFLREQDTKRIMETLLQHTVQGKSVTLDDVCEHFGVSLTVLQSVHALVRNIIRHRERKAWDCLESSVSELKSLVSLSLAARITFIAKGSIQWLCTRPASKHCNPVTKKDIQKITSFVCRDTETQVLPMKRHAGKRFMRKILTLSYYSYTLQQQRDGDRTLSFSSFYRNLPKECRVMKETPYRMCACETCVNFHLLVAAILAAEPNYGLGIRSSVTRMLLLSVCDPNGCLQDESASLFDAERRCIFRDCKRCSGKLAQHIVQYISDRHSHLEFNEILARRVTWHQWGTRMVRGEEEYQNWPHHGPVSQLLSIFSESVKRHSVHVFNYLWQGEQYEAMKNDLQEGEALWVLDFAMNFGIKNPLEPQQAHWTRKQVTMHPIVANYTCTKCEVHHAVIEELLFVTDDKTHDPFAVDQFETEALEYFEKKGVSFHTIF